jgi:AcrR family transcriptional regulator
MTAAIPPAQQATAPGRRLGRPPRISREQIADAAIEVGLSDLTLRAVADHLGVTVAALYHHVDGKDDLLRLAADRSARRLTVPEDRGQHWAVWLLEWAAYNRAAFVADSALLDQFIDGAISPAVIARNTEAFLSVLVRQGFTVDEAAESFELISASAIGLAVATIRARRAAGWGGPSPSDEMRRVAEEDPTELPLMSELAEHDWPDADDRAMALLRSVVLGLALTRGEDAADVSARLEDANLDGGP